MPCLSMTEKCVVLSPSPLIGMSFASSSLGVAFLRLMLAACFLAYSFEVSSAGIFAKAASPRKRARSQRARRMVSAIRCSVSGDQRPIFQIVILQNIEHLHHADAAGAGRWGAINVVAAVSAMDRLA